MLFGKIKNLQEEIVEIIIKNEVISSKEIKKILDENNVKYSIQAIYKQLKTLLSENVITKHKMRYKIHNEWRQKLTEKTSKFNLFFLPSPGEKIKYNFNSPIHLEIFDKDITYGIYNQLPRATLFVYTYHYIWPLMKKRIESYLTYLSVHKKENRYAFYNVACSDPLDIFVKKEIENDFYRLTKNENLSYIEKNNLTMILGPYIIQSSFDENKMEKIDKIYKSKLSKKEQIEKIQSFFTENQRCKTTIENNLKKAHKIKKAMSKSFLLPESVKNELKKEEENLN